MNWKKRAISLLLALVFVAALLPTPQARAAAPTIPCPSCGARNWEWAFADTDPSCTDPGSEYWACKDCGQEQSVSLPALGHSWSDWEPTPLGVPPSCTEGGKLLHYCSRCGTTETSDFPALGHAWDGGKVTREASCTADGSSLYTCSRCGVTETRSIAALGHAWDEGKETKEASCTEEGSADYSCERCDAKETRKLDPLGHDWEEKERTEPEGIRDGKILSVCRRCGEEKGEAIPVLAGDFFKSLRNNPSNADKAPTLRITSHPKGGVIERGSGEKLTLRVEVSGGVEPYRYAWYVSGEEAEAAARSAAMSKFSKSVSGAAGRAGRSQANIASSWLNARINSNISDMHGQRMAAMAEAMAKGGSFSLLRDVKLSDSPLRGSDGPEYETAYGNCRYWCVVTDAAGNEAISNAARVGYHLRIAEQPQNANLQPEGKALLSCQAADGLGFYSYKWLDAQGNTVGEAQTVSVTEEGAYCCVVSDGEDSLTSEPATVYSIDPFLIESFNRDTKKWPEENLRLSASFTGGVPPYEVWWDYEGEPLPTEQNGNDPKGNPAYRADGKLAGLYTVHATDAMGATLTRSVRRVEKQIEIAEQPVGGLIPEGLPMPVDVKIGGGGKAPYTYIFYFNGQERVRSSEEEDTEYGFRAWYPGEYYIHITDANGHSATTDKVVFEDAGFCVAKQPEDAKLMSTSDKAKLILEVAGGVEPYHYQWVKHDKGLGFAVGTDSPVFYPTQLGEYSCKITDAEGQRIRSRRVTVSYGGQAPLIITQPTPRTIMDWDEFPKLRCSAVSGSGDDENLSYVWYWSGSDTGWYQDRYGGPTIPATTTGFYRCRVIDRSTGKYTESEIAVVSEELKLTKWEIEDYDWVHLKKNQYTTAHLAFEGGIPPFKVHVRFSGQKGGEDKGALRFRTQKRQIAIDDIEPYDLVYYYTPDGTATMRKVYRAQYYVIVTDASGATCQSQVVEVPHPGYAYNMDNAYKMWVDNLDVKYRLVTGDDELDYEWR